MCAVNSDIIYIHDKFMSLNKIKCHIILNLIYSYLSALVAI
eukprot:SAG31_NODE_12865_length_910_cov_2.394575_2_plen_40_part_01